MDNRRRMDGAVLPSTMRGFDDGVSGFGGMAPASEQSQYERQQQARLDANQAEKDRKLQEWTDRRNDADSETERNMRANEAEARRIIADFERVGQESTANMRRNRG